MTDAYNAGREAGVKRHEWKLPAANWLREEINETLSRYDIHSDVYEQDVRIDALCVVAVDKITALLDVPAPAATVDDVAFALWKEGADRAAPNVGKSRTPEGFADLLPEEKERWRSQARAALRALSEAKP